jgi:hypothetical protein
MAWVTARSPRKFRAEDACDRVEPGGRGRAVGGIVDAGIVDESVEAA